MVYFILKSTSLRSPLVHSSCSTKNSALDALEKCALDFIRDEEGNKKAQNAFVLNEEELKKNNDMGYFLIKHSADSISVYEKKQIVSYFSTTLDVREIINYSITEYNFTKEKTIFNPDIEIVHLEQSVSQLNKQKTGKNITGVDLKFMDELKLQLVKIRMSID